MTRRKCPVCAKGVGATTRRNVAPHTDTAGRKCPFSGEPFDAALDLSHPPDRNTP